MYKTRKKRIVIIHKAVKVSKFLEDNLIMMNMTKKQIIKIKVKFRQKDLVYKRNRKNDRL